jgi:hypothetical protein
VNAHAKELRSKFVQHEEQITLTVEELGTRYTLDFGKMAERMTKEIRKNVCDFTPVSHKKMLTS